MGGSNTTAKDLFESTNLWKNNRSNCYADKKKCTNYVSRLKLLSWGQTLQTEKNFDTTEIETVEQFKQLMLVVRDAAYPVCDNCNGGGLELGYENETGPACTVCHEGTFANPKRGTGRLLNSPRTLTQDDIEQVLKKYPKETHQQDVTSDAMSCSHQGILENPGTIEPSPAAGADARRLMTSIPPIEPFNGQNFALSVSALAGVTIGALLGKAVFKRFFAPKRNEPAHDDYEYLSRMV